MKLSLFSDGLLRLRPAQARWAVALILLALLLIPFTTTQAQSGDVGYRDFPFPSKTGGDSQATAEKAESKIWWNDGSWYGSLWSTSGNAYHIFRLNLTTQTWIDTGTAIDDRLASKGDALWDGSKLYVASHRYAATGAAASASQRGRLYRYSYQSSNKSYTLDSGFPVEITGGKSETLVIAKDSSGQLWVTYVENKIVMVNHSQNGNDSSWGQPYALPAGGNEVVNSDDISSVTTYDNQVGIMWSSQKSPYSMYFAVHTVGTSDRSWSYVRSYAVSGDDHINLKTLQADDAGNVFAVIKTDRGASLIVVLVCQRNAHHCDNVSDWQSYVVYNTYDHNPTRPQLVIDETNRQLYVFTHNEDPGSTYPRPGGIYYKRADIDNIAFDGGSMGTPFIRTEQDIKLNNPTTSKQNVNATTGLLVLASDSGTKMYLHNYLSLGDAPPPPPPPPPVSPSISGFMPISGVVGTEVTLSGANLSQVNGVSFNNTPALSYTIDSDTQIRAIVPSGAVSGPLQVSSPNGSATSSASFTVTSLPPEQFSLATSVSGSGTLDLSPPGGSYAANTVVTVSAQAASGWQFTGWQGDASGSANPLNLTMDGNKNLTAIFQQTTTGGGGSVIYLTTVSGVAQAANTVSAAGIAGGADGFYLAAIGTRSSMAAVSVSGLGLNWSLLARQCAGRNQTMIELWTAQGTPTNQDAVTAQFDSNFKSAVIAVSRYDGVDSAQPLGGLVTGNTLGAAGACSGGSDSSSYAFSLPTASSGGLVVTAVTMRNKSNTPGSAATERAEVSAGSGGDVASVALQDQPVAGAASVNVSGTLSGSVDWAVIAVELRAAP